MTFNDIKIGGGYDVHALKEGLPMFLCGIKIESKTGFVAHSDGDVAIHALCDAILGALALGDIGKLFPDTSDQWKGIDSQILLQKVIEEANKRGYYLGNADITIALQAPKLRGYIDDMRENLARIVKTDISNISVKATTTEKLGFTGREEGCQSWAHVLMIRS